MKKQLKIFLTGLFLLIPIAVTIYVVVWAAMSIDAMGTAALRALSADAEIPLITTVDDTGQVHVRFGVGLLVVLVLVYVVGLLAKLWVFESLFNALDRLLSRIPGIKTIYESVRDLIQMFGGDSEKMGKVVLYRQPGTDIVLLGIMTNESPAGVAENFQDDRVAVYQPFSYMFGGPTIYVPAENVTEIDMSVDQALKLGATAHLGATTMKKIAASDPTAATDRPESDDRPDPHTVA
jgi:uncharacterized membrane protein